MRRRRHRHGLPCAGVALVALVALAAGGCGGGGETTSAARLPNGCQRIPEPPAKHVELKRPRGASAKSPLKATVDTSCGSFEIALNHSAPKTVASFAYLARKNVYDDTAFHRIVPGFVIQGGDPEGTGTGGPGYFVDEPPPPDTEYTKGTVAMAKTQAEPAGRSGSQFFVVVAADAGLPPSYAVLGRVTRGMSTVVRIARLGDRKSGSAGTPRAPVVIDDVNVKG
jgi:peptidyl-prolyl cis-trans isomerase B (cyclophilin B)